MYGKRNVDKLGGCVNICRYWFNIWEGIVFEFKILFLKYFIIKCIWGKGFVFLVYIGVIVFLFNVYVFYCKVV